MRARVLPPAEWGRLDGQELSALTPYVHPENIKVLVVEDEHGKIVAQVGLLTAVHFEGLEIDPEHRGNAGVFRLLIREAFALARQHGEEWAFGGAKDGDERMAELLRRLGGVEMPVRFSAISVKGS